MQRTCEECGAEYEAKRASSRFHSAACRVRAHRRTHAGLPKPEQAAPAAPVLVCSVADAVQVELDEADRTHSAAGQAALVLAARIDGRSDTGSAVAAMVKELRATLEAAVGGAPPAADPLDEIAAARAARIARAGG